MEFNLTNAGINTMLRALSGSSIVFTRVKIGNGAAQSTATATDLSNPLYSFAINAITVANNKASLTVTLANSNIEAGFRLTEMGIFAQDQNDATQEVLYAYATAQEEKSDYVAESGYVVLEEDLTVDAFVSNAENVSALINESLVYATKASFDAHLNDTNNPHAVTKTQVGLGNVPNVDTNDQTPTYTEATSDANLTSGERLTVAMGKIARAVRSLIGHLANKNNPHAVTAAQVGAATSGHKHSAADVTSGTLGVARGGTGKSSWTANRLMYPSAATTLAQLGFPSAAGQALHQGTSGAPFWDYPVATESGSYTGSNFSGSSNANTITFKKAPKLVFIMENGHHDRWGLLFPAASRGFSIYNGVTSDLIVSASGTTVRWYLSSGGAANQLNAMFTYRYVGIY